MRSLTQRSYSMIHRATKGTPIKVIEDKDSADAADGGPMTTLEIDSRVELFCKVRWFASSSLNGTLH